MKTPCPAAESSRAGFPHARIFLLQVAAVLGLALAANAQVPPNPVPFIHQPLVPTAVQPGGPDFTLTVNGAGLVPESVIHWSGSPRPTTFVSNIQLTAAIPAADIATIGSASVTVVNPAPGGGVSNAVLLLVAFPTPTVAFTQTDFGGSGGAEAVVTTDLNADGNWDVAVLRTLEILILLGNGEGMFQPRLSVPRYGYVDSPTRGKMIAADFNQDGKGDLAFTYYQLTADGPQGSISVFLGNGDGSFQSAVDYPELSFGPSAIICADLNGDGAPDLAVAGRTAGGGGVRILIGVGDGNFQPSVEYSQTNGSPNGTAAGDFNGGNVLDLLVPGFPILLGNGDGTFQQGDFTAGMVTSVTAADFNGDGNLDFAQGTVGYTSVSHSNVSIRLGAGDGNFVGSGSYSTGHAIGAPYELVAVDVNGDGKLDIVAAESQYFAVLFGNEDGTFQTPTTLYPAPSLAVSLAAADFDVDGRVDFPTGN